MTRGRQAETPVAIPVSGWGDIAKRVWGRFGALHLPLLAAGVAFYGLLSLFPGLTAAVALIGLVFDPGVLVTQSDWLLSLLPEAAAGIVSDQLSQIAGAEGGTLSLAALVSLALALWSASAAIGSVMQALGVIYEEPEERGFIKLKLMTIALTLAIVAVLALVLAVIAAIPAALTFLGARAGLTDLVMLIRWPLMFLLGIGAIALLYRIGPDRRAARWRWLTPGAVLACLLWVAVSFGFSVYVQNFAGYTETFGALAGVIVLLMWMWLSALVVFLGAVVDAEIEAQTGRDTTIGPDRPRGARGAVKADVLGSGPDTETETDDAARAEPQPFAAR